MIASKIRTLDMVSDSSGIDDNTAVKKVKNSEDSDATSDNVDQDGDKLTKMARAFKTIIEVPVDSSSSSSSSSIACVASLSSSSSVALFAFFLQLFSYVFHAL
jgi:hypothetical protein